MATETQTTVIVAESIMNATSLRSIFEACAYIYRPQRNLLIGIVSEFTWTLEEIKQNKCDSSARRLVKEAGESWESFRDALAAVCKDRADEASEHLEIGQANSWLTMAERVKGVP